jgi:type IV pilus assembly protein PilO
MPGGNAMKQILLEIYRLKKRCLIAMLLLLLTNIAMYAFIHGHQNAALNEARIKCDELRSRLTTAERGDVSAVYRRGLSDLDKLKAIIPPKRGFPLVLGGILDDAASGNLAVKTISYKPQIVKNEDLLEYDINMSVSGSYAAVKSFLADLQKKRELIVIDTIALSNADLFEENVSMNIRMTVYLREGA